MQQSVHLRGLSNTLKGQCRLTRLEPNSLDSNRIFPTILRDAKKLFIYCMSILLIFATNRMALNKLIKLAGWCGKSMRIYNLFGSHHRQYTLNREGCSITLKGSVFVVWLKPKFRLIFAEFPKKPLHFWPVNIFLPHV